MNKRIGSIVLFVLIGIAQFFTDLLITRYCDVFDIHKWTVFKSGFFIAASIATLGFGSSYIRFSKYWENSYIRSAVFPSVLFVSFVVAWFFNQYLDNLINVKILGIVIFSFAINSFNGDVFRSKGRYIKGQISIDGWRIIFLLILISWFVLNINISFNLLFRFFFCSIIGICLYDFFDIFRKNTNDKIMSIRKIRHFFLYSFLFLLFSITAIFSSYSDQVFCKYIDSGYMVSVYLSHLTFFFYPFGLLNKMIGFFLLPMLSRRKLSLYQLRKNIVRSMFLYLFILMIITSFLVVVYKYYYAGKYNIDIMLVFMLLIYSFVRCLYVIYSCILTVYVPFKAMVRLLKSYWLILFLQVFFSYISISIVYPTYLLLLTIILANLARFIVLKRKTDLIKC